MAQTTPVVSQNSSNFSSPPQFFLSLSDEERSSICSYVSDVLSTAGELTPDALQHMADSWGLEAEDSLSFASYIEENEDLAPPVWQGEGTVTIRGTEYQVGAVLGSGKYAEVRRGRRTEDGLICALKILYIDCPRRTLRLLREQIKEEIKAIKTIRHRNIVRLLDYTTRTSIEKAGAEPRGCMIQVQELCSKGELFDYVQYNGALAPDLARTIFYQFMSALHACHSKGIAHRDLKPDNILLNERFTLKICDFGFAKSFQDQQGHRFTTTLGTRGYMAPEVIAQLPYDAKADIFSSGVILFILLAGYPPLQEAILSDWWFARLVEGRVAKFWQAHEQVKQFSVEAKHLIIKMLEPQPQDRYSAAEVLQSDWMQGRLMSREQYQSSMAQLKANIDLNKATVRDAEFTNAENYIKQEGNRKYELREFLEPLYTQKLQEVEEQSDLVSLLLAIGTKHNEDKIRTPRLKMDDPQAAASSLAVAEVENQIMDVIDLSRREARVLLNELKDTLLADACEEVTEERHQYYGFSSIVLPTFDPFLNVLPLASYRMNCGFDVIAFALRYFTKSKFKGGPSKMKLSRKGKIGMQFKKKVNKTLPDEESEAFVPVVAVTDVTIEIEAVCFQCPKYESSTIVGFKRKSGFDTAEQCQAIIDEIVGQTFLCVFEHDEKPDFSQELEGNLLEDDDDDWIF